MASSTELTLAIPYYSGFALFLRTLRSIAAQRHDGCRVLVVDDSPAGLDERARAELAAALGERFPLRILRNEQNLGMARSWNRCLDEAQTELVTIVHNDDELTPDYAAAMVELAAREPGACALFSGAQVIGGDGQGTFSFPDAYKLLLIPRHREVLRLSGEPGIASLLRGNYIYAPSVCYRKARLGGRRFDPQYKFVLDMDFTLRLLLEGETLAGLPGRPLYRYRRHAENATSLLTRELTRFDEESSFYLRIAREASARGYPGAARVARRRRIIQLNLGFCIARDLAGRRWQDGARKLSLFGRLFLAPGGAAG